MLTGRRSSTHTPTSGPAVEEDEDAAREVSEAAESGGSELAAAPAAALLAPSGPRLWCRRVRRVEVMARLMGEWV